MASASGDSRSKAIVNSGVSSRLSFAEFERTAPDIAASVVLRVHRGTFDAELNPE